MSQLQPFPGSPIPFGTQVVLRSNIFSHSPSFSAPGAGGTGGDSGLNGITGDTPVVMLTTENILVFVLIILL